VLHISYLSKKKERLNKEIKIFWSVSDVIYFACSMSIYTKWENLSL